ncbi:MAG: hypothetical protein GY853_09835 [PVC group bacterium]|nr:hypothetical protein [PVC group bacterium]
MAGSYRSQFQEQDLAGFISPTGNETGAMLINSPKGAEIPVKCTSENDIFTYFGTPSASYPEVFEALSYVQEAPLWVSSPHGDGVLWGGLDVKSGTVEAFASGRVDPVNYMHSDATVSHSFFAYSPYTDDLKMNITTSGTKYTLLLYKVESGNDVYLNTYNYSLSREKDNFGKQLYIDDVFTNNPYVIPKVNSSYSGASPLLSATTKIAFVGGARGDTPVEADYSRCWDYFKKPNKYPAKTFMDVNGLGRTYINTIIASYQYYSHGISVVPFGNDYEDAITARGALDTDNLSLYTNWRKIYDPYNDSYAWISNVGSVGKNYALMEPFYDGLAPAGISEGSNPGGQISDWRTIEMEYDYDDTALQLLDEAQINPVILDELYGVMAYGNKTMQVSLSDTSYIQTRRIYNYVIEKVVTQVLKRTEFKNIDTIHMNKAKSMTDTLLSPILAEELLAEALVVCDTTNNTSVTRTNRQFVLDVYVKAQVDAEFTILNLIRVGQNTVIATLV